MRRGHGSVSREDEAHGEGVAEEVEVQVGVKGEEAYVAGGR